MSACSTRCSNLEKKVHTRNNRSQMHSLAGDYTRTEIRKVDTDFIIGDSLILSHFHGRLIHSGDKRFHATRRDIVTACRAIWLIHIMIIGTRIMRGL